MPMTPEQMGAAIRRNLPKKTGHTFEEWVDLARRQQLGERKAIVAWRKASMASEP